jgi:vitamin B12 transport system substrate-binding protein
MSTSYAKNDDLTQHKAQRIVALAPHIVEMLFDIGAGNKIVGAVAYSDYPKAALDIPRVGSYHGMQIEKLLALNPDLVIVWKSGNSQSDIDKIKRLGINVVLSNPVNIDDVATELRYFGGLTGHEKQAEIAALAYEKHLKTLRIENQNKQPIPVFYQLWSEPMMTINGSTWINQLIEVCQGVNVFKSNPTPYPKISTENVIVAQPHLMILPDENSDKPQPIIDWQKWPEIPAVKNNKFIHVDADLLHRFSTRMLNGIEDMCEKIDQHR